MDFQAILKMIMEKLLPIIKQKVEERVQENDKEIQVAVEPEAPKAEEKPQLKKLTLKRTLFRDDGIFGDLWDGDTKIASTCEHSYDKKPKLYNGTFVCVRGEHRLHGMDHDFVTFEITGVEGHSHVLLHPGNTQNDSEGCVLLGQELVIDKKPDGLAMVTNSKITFAKFMSLMGDMEKFELVVE